MAIKNRINLYVPMKAGTVKFKYGFRGYDVTGGATLGHLKADGIAQVIYGCNSPRPPRVGKILSGSFRTTFCDPTKLPAAIKDKWRQTSGAKYRSGFGGVIKKAYQVPFDNAGAGLFYGQYLRPTIAAALTNVGLEAISTGAESEKTLWGCDSHKPQQAKGEMTISGVLTSVSLFIGHGETFKTNAEGHGLSVTGAIGA